MAPSKLDASRGNLALSAAPSAVFDWLENYAVANMLNLNIEDVTPEIVVAASRWAVLKGIATTAAVFVLFVRGYGGGL